MHHTTYERGFTLLEMVTVIFIIGVLSTIVLAGLQSSREKARDDERVTDLATLQLALEMYYNACGRQYPAPASGALDLTAHNGCSGSVEFGTFAKTPLPKDPLNSTDYVYAVNATPPTDYVLKATFETAHRKLSEDVDGTKFASPAAGPETSCGANDATDNLYCVTP